MKDTLGNREKFNALYWMQEVGATYSDKGLKVDGDYLEYLELKPLSQITDEDAVEVAKKYHHYNETALSDRYGALELLVIDGKEIISGKDVPYGLFQHSECIDYLRSKSYALPFNGLSIEDLIKYGWIRLEE